MEFAGGDSESHRASSRPDSGVGVVDRWRGVECYWSLSVPRHSAGDLWRIADHSRIVLIRLTRMKPTAYFIRLSAALLLALVVTPLAYIGILAANLAYISSGSNWAITRTIAIVTGVLLFTGPICILVILGRKHRLPNYMKELSFRNLFRWQLIILVSLMAFGIGLAEAATHLY